MPALDKSDASVLTICPGGYMKVGESLAYAFLAIVVKKIKHGNLFDSDECYRIEC